MKVLRVSDSSIDNVLSVITGKRVGFDIETDSLDAEIAKPCVVQIYFDDIVYLFPVEVIDAHLSRESIMKLMRCYQTLALVGHQLFYDVSVIYRSWGILPAQISDDTFILACMVQAPQKGLKDLALIAKPELVSKLAKFDSIWTETLTYSFQNIDQVRYMAYDPYLPIEVVLPYLYRDELLESYQVELSVLIPLVVSYVTGMFVDLTDYKGSMKELENEHNKIQTRIDLALGYPIRVNSVADVRKALFEDKKLPVPPIKTDKGEISVSTESLLFLEGNPLVDDIIALKSLISVESSCKKVPDLLDKDSYVHPRYQQVGFDGTSRIYTKPSINQWPMAIRSLIKPAKGKKFVHADWKAAEMYIAAYLANQENLLEVYSAGGDIHSWLAEKVLGFSNPTKEQREISKVCEFAFIYGSEGAAVSRKLRVSDDKGRSLVASFVNYLSRIKALRDRTQEESARTHKTCTILGRPRVLSKYDDPRLVSTAARQAFNTKIQGSCADLQKIAIAKLYEMRDPRVSFKFTVFDSFLLEVDDDMTNEEIEAILNKMSDFSDRFPGFHLRYSYGIAYDWRSAQELA